MWRGYIAITAPDSKILGILNDCCLMGMENDHPNPSHRVHWRYLANLNGAIIEAAWDENTLTSNVFMGIIEQMYDESPAVDVSQSGGNDVYVYTIDGVERLSVMIAGGLGSSYQASQSAITAYLIASNSTWQGGAAYQPIQGYLTWHAVDRVVYAV